VAFYFNLITGVIFSLLIFLTSGFYLNWIKTPSEAYNDAHLYSMIAGGTVVFQLLSTTLSSFLKANNQMKTSMIITIIVNILNIIGNYIFIKAFRSTYPIIGVALSSALSRLIGFILMLVVFMKTIKVKLSFKSFLTNKQMLKKIIQVGGPSGGESVSYQSSQIIIQIVINQIVLATANVGIGNIKTYAAIFAMITYMFTSAVSQAMQVVIGELMGAKEIEATKKTVYKTMFMAIIASELIAVIFWLASDQLFGLFKVYDKELLKIGKQVMLVEILLEFGRAINIVMVRSLQTSGDVLFPTILAVIFCWVVAVGGSFLFGYPKENGISLGLMGVWLAMAIDECARALIFIIRFKGGRWQKFNLTL
jgi:Na+-driven multidrug efflux pump